MTAALNLEEPLPKTLRIAQNLSLPLETVTQTVAILAIKRSGKSFTAKRIAEQMFKAGLQIVCVDPKGDWWGLRSSADGKGPGLGILILGGEHGDLPLEVGSGELVAKLVVEERVSVVLDLSHFRKHEVAIFMAAFGEALYRLKNREEFRTPVMVIVDEADAVAPQKPQENEARMLGAWQDIVRRGGQRGIGSMFVTQRSAVLNKDLLTQAQVLIALRTISPQDRKAMDAWIEVHGTPEQRSTLMESLPSLPRGDAWVWSPGWPTDEGIFQRVHVLPIETFDSGATPKPGERRIEPKRRADVDLEALRRAMAETVERQKANDPKELRAEVARLRREIEQAKKATPASVPAKVETKTVEVPALKDGQAKRLEALTGRLDAAVQQIGKLNDAIQSAKADIVAALLRATAKQSERASPSLAVARPASPLPRASPARSETVTHRPRQVTVGDGPPEGGLGKGERQILAAVAQHREGVTREQLTVLTGYKRSSRDTYLQRLRSRELVVDGERITATDAGVAVLGPDFEPLPTGDALRAYWLDRLSGGERAILKVLVEAYPNAVDREAITEVTSYQRSSRDTYLQRLRSRQLVADAGRGLVRASDTLFDGDR